MKTEVQCACAFLSRLLQSKNLPVQFADVFRNKLEDLLLERFKNHWDAANPNKGSAYRCIRINTKMDPVVETAARVTGLANIKKYLPPEFTLWVDPDDVSYRFGEDGSICSCPLDAHNSETDWFSSPPSPKTVSRVPKTRQETGSRNLSPLVTRKHHYPYMSNVYSGLTHVHHMDYAISVQV